MQQKFKLSFFPQYMFLLALTTFLSFADLLAEGLDCAIIFEQLIRPLIYKEASVVDVLNRVSSVCRRLVSPNSLYVRVSKENKMNIFEGNRIEITTQLPDQRAFKGVFAHELGHSVFSKNLEVVQSEQLGKLLSALKQKHDENLRQWKKMWDSPFGMIQRCNYDKEHQQNQKLYFWKMVLSQGYIEAFADLVAISSLNNPATIANSLKSPTLSAFRDYSPSYWQKRSLNGQKTPEYWRNYVAYELAKQQWVQHILFSYATARIWEMYLSKAKIDEERSEVIDNVFHAIHEQMEKELTGLPEKKYDKLEDNDFWFEEIERLNSNLMLAIYEKKTSPNH